MNRDSQIAVDVKDKARQLAKRYVAEIQQSVNEQIDGYRRQVSDIDEQLQYERKLHRRELERNRGLLTRLQTRVSELKASNEQMLADSAESQKTIERLRSSSQLEEQLRHERTLHKVELEHKEDRIAKLQAQVRELNATNKRLLAESQTVGKRLRQTYAQQAEKSKEALLTEHIGVMDNLELALNYAYASSAALPTASWIVVLNC